MRQNVWIREIREIIYLKLKLAVRTSHIAQKF